MAITNGQTADADEVLNAIGSNFNDVAQNLFNADYIGFDSRLGNAGAPSLKNVKYSTFTTDDADVNYGFAYDATNDLYEAPESEENNLIYFDIYATSVNTGTLTDSVNDVYCFPISDGVWRLSSSAGSMAEATGRLFNILFKDMVDSATDPNGVTGLTELRCSDSAYQSKGVVWIKNSHSRGGTSNVSGYTIGTLSATDTNTSYLFDFYGTSSSSGSCYARAKGPLTSTIISSPNNGTTDQRDSGTIHSVTSADGFSVGGDMAYGGISGPTAGWTTTGVFVFSDSLTITKSTSGGGGGTNVRNMSSKISISASAPAFSQYESTLIFKDTVTSTDNAIPVINSSIDATSSEQISISADGGLNWTDVDNAEVARPTAGTELWRRIVITRTDLSKLDKVTEQAVKYELY